MAGVPGPAPEGGPKRHPFTLRLPHELHERVELARGDVPKQVWIERAIEMRLVGGPQAHPQSAQRSAPGRQPRGVVTQRKVNQ